MMPALDRAEALAILSADKIVAKVKKALFASRPASPKAVADQSCG